MFGFAFDQLFQNNSPYVIDDVDSDPRTAAFRAEYYQMGVAADAAVPIRKRGHIVAAIGVHQNIRRHWRPEELTLLQLVADRCWESNDRTRITKALRDSEERLQQVFTQAPVGICVLRGREMIFELANATYREILPGRQIVGRPMLEVVPEVKPNVVETIHHVLDTGEPFIANELLVPLDRDGDGYLENVWFNLAYHPLRDSDGAVSGVVLIAVNVTTNVQARHELERANHELEEFAFVASHDLQEPLRMINIYTQLLLENHVDPSNESAIAFADRIRNGVNRLETLIRDLLAYSRAIHEPQEPARSEMDLNQALDEALESLRPTIESTGAIILRGDLPRVSGEQSQMYSLFQNLLSNSIKYANEGVIPRIDISAELNGGEWIVRVADNGIGFDQKYADRIFGLFKRLCEKDVPGTGLGLAICRRIVERNGGHIWAESHPGQGSKFFFTLPL